MGTVVGHRPFGPQAPHQRHLLVEPFSPVREVLAERLVLDPVPPEPDAESESSPREEIDLGGLLGGEDGLALREDDDARDELDGRDRGQVPEEHERLVESRRDVVGAAPASVDFWVRADDMVVREDMGEAERLDSVAVCAHGADVAAELRLREDDTDPHARHGIERSPNPLHPATDGWTMGRTRVHRGLGVSGDGRWSGRFVVAVPGQVDDG